MTPNYLLEAFCPENLSWLKPVPRDRAVNVGRLGFDHPDPNQPESNRSEWVIPGIDDVNISGRHFSVEIQNGKVVVLLNMSRPRRKLHYRGGECERIDLAPGEHFSIGQHTFRLKLEEAAQPVYQQSLPMADLEKAVFRKADHFLPAIEKLASIEMSDAKYLTKFLRVLGPALAAFKGRVAAVELHDRGGESEKAVIEAWAPNADRLQMKPSRSLMTDARLAPRNASRARFGDAGPQGSLVGQCEWAVCVSVPQLERETRWGLYADGMLPDGVRNEAFEKDDLEDITKLVSVAARLLGNWRHCQFYRELADGLRSFIPAKLRNLVETRRDLDTFRAAPLPITCLIGDVRGSCIIDSCAVQTLVTAQQQIEQVLTDITGAIADTGGIVGGLQGDAAMGFWGWPRGGEAAHSIDGAVTALARIRRTYEDKNHPLWGAGRPGHGVHFGLGLAFGEALAGIMGVQEFRRIDLFGPVVNLAARLESLTKTLGVPIAVNEPVAQYLRSRREADSQYAPEAVAMGRYRLAGMEQSLRVYELLPEGLTPKVASRSVVNDWETMLDELFEKKDWTAARAALEDLCDQAHFGKLAAALLEQLSPHLRPPEHWQGFFDVDKAGHLQIARH